MKSTSTFSDDPAGRQMSMSLDVMTAPAVSVDYRDDVIEALADYCARLEDERDNLAAERNAYELVAKESLHYCRELGVLLRAERERRLQLLNEYRHLRERTLLATGEVVAA